MIPRENFVFVKRKESVIIFAALTPIIVLLAIPAVIVLIIRGIYAALKQSKTNQ
jgi:hypothetical protein